MVPRGIPLAPAIETHQLTKVFSRPDEVGRGLRGLLRNKLHPMRREIMAVDHVDLEIPRGELFGLLGPNGAGKTTLVKLLCTLLLPTSGGATVGGRDIVAEGDQVRQYIGVVLGGERALYWRLTGRENLLFFAQLYNIGRREAQRLVGDLLHLVGLGERGDDRVENYSKGMKQRLHLARGLINDPEVLLLDEPTIGLDPLAARDVRRLIRDLCTHQGRTVILTTHYMFEADEMSDRVGIIRQGRIVALDTPEKLKRELRERSVLRVEVQRAHRDLRWKFQGLPDVLEAAEVGSNVDHGSVTYRVLTADPERLTPSLVDLVHRADGRILALAVETPTLEDVFLELTGSPLQEAVH